MQRFNRESRQSIYFDVSYVIARQWSPDTMERLDFQKALAERQLDFPKTSVGLHDFTLVRIEQSHLQVKIASLGPGVSSISISSESPVHTLDLFAMEAEAVCEAYRRMWLKEQCQILQSNARIRHLYSCGDYAFKFLWEDRLSQSPEDFRHLSERPVLGGGLRLVIPPLPAPASGDASRGSGKEDTEPVQIEIKIESFFREPKKMFIDTFFVWPKPRLLAEDEKFDTGLRLESVERYAAEQVCNFLLHSKKEY